MSSKKNIDRRQCREAAFNVLFCQHFTEAPLSVAVSSVEATESVEALKEVRGHLAALIHAAESAVSSLDKALDAVREAASDANFRVKPTGKNDLTQDRRWVLESREALEKSLANVNGVLDRTGAVFTENSFTDRLLRTYENNAEEIDRAVQKSLKGWTQDRLTAADGALLRLGITEMLHFSDVPPKVIVNEYVELARRFGGDDAHKLVNAVLDRVMRENPRPEQKAR